LLQNVGWEWIFLINVPIGAGALLMGWRLLPHSNAETSNRLDLIGLLLLSPALAAIIFAISEVRTVADLDSAAVLIPFVTSLVLLVAFVVRSLRMSAPLLDLRLFQGRTFSAAAVTSFALGAATFGAVFLVPLYFQQVRHTSVLVTGLLTTPQALGMAVSMSLTGRLADKIGAGWVVPTGLVLAIGALLGFTTLNGTTSFWVIAGYLALMGLGLGASMMPAMSAAYASLASAAAVSRATAELQIVQRVGSALGVALFAVILQQRMPAVSRSGVPPTTDQLATAFSSTFYWGVGLSALALIPALLLPRRDLGVRAAIQGHCQPLAGNAPFAGQQRRP
jgi:EmrB/QacA subfamily drug resistance transporter